MHCNSITSFECTQLTDSLTPLLQTVANLGTISAVNFKGAASDTYTAMTNTYGAAWEVTNQPSYPISLEVTSGSQTVSTPVLPYNPSQCNVSLLVRSIQTVYTSLCLVLALSLK